MNTDALRRWSAMGAFATTPFLFGANGKGCTPVPFGVDGGADGTSSPTSEDASLVTEDGDADRVVASNGGACVSSVGGPCGGFTQAPCSCAPGLVCKANRIPDVPGICVRQADTCVDNVLCVQGDHWDPVLCKCVADAGVPSDADCVDNALCIQGDHWDPVLCKCVPDAPREAGCVDNVLCIRGDQWDPALCRCVPDASDGGGCTTAADCHGVLPQICTQTCDGGPGACAHFVCRNGSCATALCE